ncbi:MAG: response regulator [Candidatus Rokuibacteriota bacterium]
MRVLVVDDDAMIRRLLESTLTRWKYEVVIATDGEKAWEILKQDDAPSLALMDWTMPRMDGLELCKRVRTLRRSPRPYLIFLTAKGRIEDIVTGLEAGADDYMIKPFEREELRARIHAGLRVIELERSLADRVVELEEALHKVKLLQGLIPICAWCKKVRDDRNYWQQVEQYVTEHSEARFTHSICPDCRAKYIDPEIQRAREEREAREPDGDAGSG